MGEKAGRFLNQNDLELIVSALRMRLKDSIKKLSVNLKNEWEPRDGKVDVVKLSICRYGELYVLLNTILEKEEWIEYNYEYEPEKADKYIRELLSNEFNYTNNKHIIKYIKG
jgi:hypothetical protein